MGMDVRGGGGGGGGAAAALEKDASPPYAAPLPRTGFDKVKGATAGAAEGARYDGGAGLANPSSRGVAAGRLPSVIACAADTAECAANCVGAAPPRGRSSHEKRLPS